uniref:Ufm1-specific protease 2 n=1 Tax=Gadus morhua TaxID=8049 RepID=A0A8C5BAG3_GADMO
MVYTDATVPENGIIWRVKGQLELRCYPESTDAIKKSISQTFETLRSQMKSESLVFTVCDSSVVIWPNKDVYSPHGEVSSNTLCEELQRWIKCFHYLFVYSLCVIFVCVGLCEHTYMYLCVCACMYVNVCMHACTFMCVCMFVVINLCLMKEVSRPGPLPVPTLTRTLQSGHALLTTLPMDCVIRSTAHQPIGVACNHLLDALTSQLSEMEKAALQNMKGTTLLVPEPYHFLLPEPRGLVTIVYPAGVPDSQLESHRKELHGRFDLPEDRPYFRKPNAFRFPDQVHKDGYLRNPHQVLTHPSLDNGKLYLVQGVYSYHHYMQDRMEDNGWGCAYRSLQTVCSWFQQQGYAERPVPSHREIQQALVDMGDKQASFVGSRQWIGSIEVAAVLDQLLGITSKIMFVSQGCELASKGRELANHFLTEGTPVMIGGGVLAHTILGVAWSETTGQIRYLILDPHYTGAEDLQVISDKGWCGWKGPDFWDQTAYYNLCLPQRPRIF